MEPGGKRIDDRRTNTVETSARFIGFVIEFAARMKRRENKALRADAFLVHADGNSSAVVFYGGGTVRVKRHINCIAIAGQMLVYRIIYDFIN